MFKLLKIAKKEDPRRPRSTRRRRRRIPGAAGGRSVIDHAASTQSVILNKKSMNTYMYDLRKYISIFPARALRALGLLLADGTPTVGGGKTF